MDPKMSHIIKLVVGIIGNIVGVGVNLAPMPTFLKIYRNKSTQGFSGLPYVCALFSALLWVLYGLPMVTKNALLLITINVASCSIQIFYLTIFFTYAAKNTRIHVIKVMAACFVFLATTAVLTLTVVPQHKRSKTVGSLCVVIGVITYASPLSVAKMVWVTRSVEFLPILLCVSFLINSSIWTGYGMITKDIYVLIPNGTGVLFGTAQVALYAKFRNAKSFDDFSTDKVGDATVIDMSTDTSVKSSVCTPARKSVKSDGNSKSPSHATKSPSHATVIEMSTDTSVKSPVCTPARKPVKSDGNAKAPSLPSKDASNGNPPV